MTAKSKSFISDLLAIADIQIGGSRPWDIEVHDERLYDRIMSFGTLGFGEAYMEGWWDAEAIDQLICRILGFDLKSHIKLDLAMVATAARSRLVNLQRRRAFEVGERHYDLGNELYAAMLDRRMIYSCGYWKDATTLEEAQEAKLDLICRKAGLREGMRILDIGSGWADSCASPPSATASRGSASRCRASRRTMPMPIGATCPSRRGCRTTSRWTAPSTASSRSACSSMWG